MSRTRIAAYVPPDLAEAIKRLAAIEGVSVSDLVEDAVAKFLHTTRGEAEHAALMAKLETMQRRLIAVERSQETLFELTAHAARFSMSMAPDVPDAERTRINARGAERFAGDRTEWRPLRAFDDGRRVFIQMPDNIAVTQAPPLFISGDNGPELVNYRVHGQYYIVDRLFNKAELRLGDKRPKIVRVERRIKLKAKGDSDV